MVSFKSNAQNFRDAETMAAAYLAACFGNSEILYTGYFYPHLLSRST